MDPAALIPSPEEAASEPLCLAFANTVSYRKGTKRTDHLPGPEELRTWLAEAGLLPPDAPRSGGTDPVRHFERAIRLREAIHELCSATAAGEPASDHNLWTLNSELREALLHVRISGSKQGPAWDMSRLQTLTGSLGMLALSAANLIAGPSARRLRECADETCGWLFMDLSKNRSRKWCSMSDCGNLAKARRHYARVRKRTPIPTRQIGSAKSTSRVR